ncbi:MAG: hypothetical protein ACRBBM_12580 [Pseudomonadaceae bacterium]
MAGFFTRLALRLGLITTEEKVSPSPNRSQFKPLSKARRRELGLPKPERQTQPISGPVKPNTKPATPTRAIRTGWQLCEVAFEYEDAEGNWTDRKVTVHAVDRRVIKGECHVARAERTFRLDRVMSNITDLDTGEILDVDVWARKYR